eukprot:1182131-Prorocentrum_minimum.AAC.6
MFLNISLAQATCYRYEGSAFQVGVRVGSCPGQCSSCGVWGRQPGTLPGYGGSSDARMYALGCSRSARDRGTSTCPVAKSTERLYY